MTLSRITSTVGAVALGGVLVASTYGAAVGSATAPDHVARSHVALTGDRSDHFRPPVLHRYGANGMRMGLHCDTHDPS